METIGRVSLVTCARGVRLNQSRILLISENVTVVSDCARGCVWCCVCACVRVCECTVCGDEYWEMPACPLAASVEAVRTGMED
jgi:hypothetical protein